MKPQLHSLRGLYLSALSLARFRDELRGCRVAVLEWWRGASRGARCGLVALALFAGCAEGDAPAESKPTNVLLIVADDLGWNAPGCYGGPVDGLTPNIDRLASEGLRIEEAHVNVSVCRPSRMVLLTGRAPHQSGGEGFGDLSVPDVPHLPELLRAAGYAVGVLGKLQHSRPYADFEWDTAIDRRALGMGRSPRRFAEEARTFIERSRAEGRPWFLMANSHDPHRPLYGDDPPELYKRGEGPAERPSRLHSVEQCPVPSFLAPLQAVRRDVVAYYDSARRCDDAVGALLDALDDAGERETTLVVFLSDNGMSFPFAKASCYPNGTRVPWIVRWPAHVAPGSIGADLVTGLDFAPTILAALDVAAPAGLIGGDFLDPQFVPAEGAMVQYDQSAAGTWYPMRAVHAGGYTYVFNVWSDGERRFVRGEDVSTLSLAALERASATDAALAERLDFLRLRVPEELYDTSRDPDCLVNLVGADAHAAALVRLRSQLEAWMIATEDPALAAFRVRGSGGGLRAYLEAREAGAPR